MTCCRQWTGFTVVLLILAAGVRARGNDFDSLVAPILVANCLECHSDAVAEGGLNLQRQQSALQGGDSGPAIVPGNAANSFLWQRIRDNEMPPEHPLSDHDRAVLQKWIQSGAAWGSERIDPFAFTTDKRAGYDWWALQPLAPVTPPTTDSAWVRNEIDQFILESLSTAGLKPSPPADPRSRVRRLYFDLIGLPPSPEVVDAFVADPSDAAWDRLVDELLASHHYGERWGRHWLDVVRFGESDGFERNNPRRNAWPYRDWVIRSINRDMPYDEFVRHQLIGDQLVGGIDGAAATGFWVAGVHNTVVGSSRRMRLLARQDELEEVLGTVGQTFLGLTVNCARCHDHKFDPISQKEYYQFSSAISGLGFGERKERSADAEQQLRAVQARLQAEVERRQGIDRVARREIIAARRQGDVPRPDPPPAYARWEFEDGFNDKVGNLHVTPHKHAKLLDGALVIDGDSFASTARLPIDISSKTLEAWVQLDNLKQQGGGVISLETPDGAVFDAIVYAEQERQRWMAGSNGFARTESLQGPQETEVQDRPVHLAMVYASDGTITCYRNGLAYGRTIQKAALQKYAAGNSEIIFGLRHRTPGGNRLLKGKIYKAALYDRALSADEVAASAGNTLEYVTEEQIVTWISDEQRAQRKTMTEKIARLTKARDQLQSSARQKIYTLTAGKGATTQVLLRGDPDTPADTVLPAGVAAVKGVNADFGLAADAPESQRRQRLADWITNDANPLFMRVIVNRLWHYHFGTGLVDTPSDLGFNGGRCSHPELLNWLALRFRQDGLTWKNFHRLIVNSATYRQAAHVDETSGGAKQDADNRLLWRMTPRRLEAESIRDAMLHVSGRLDRSVGGPGFIDVSIVANNGTTYYSPIDAEGADIFRRTVYRFNPRGGRSALLDTFDCPDPASTAPRRAVTTTPLQALSLLNNAFVLRMADAFAERVQREAGRGVEMQVDYAWRLAVARSPTSEEADLSRELVQNHGLSALCRGLFNTTEFVLID